MDGSLRACQCSRYPDAAANPRGRFVEDVRDNVDRIEDCKRFKYVPLHHASMFFWNKSACMPCSHKSNPALVISRAARSVDKIWGIRE